MSVIDEKGKLGGKINIIDLIVVLVVKPTGIFGRTMAEKV